MKTNKIIISVVCYKNEREVLEFATQLEKQTMKNYIVLLVNCNKCEKPDALKEGLEGIDIESFIYILDKNIGYLHACLYGLEKYEINNQYEWCIVCNTDVEFIEQTVLENFKRDSLDENIWCVAPNIVRSSNKALQNPFLLERPSHNKMRFLKKIYSKYFLFFGYVHLAKILRLLIKQEVPDIESGDIYSADGCFIFIRHDCIQKLLKEKDKIFMYGEEIFISEIVRENGKRIKYIKSLKLIHNHNQTTKSIDYHEKQKWFNQSFDYLFERFFD